MGMGDKLVRLEAVRGLAAAAVVANHALLTFWPGIAFDPTVFPLVKVLYDGAFAVDIFFVLSGFVLSVSFFRSRDADVLSSAAVRRYVRLCLPVAASVLLAYALLRLGLMFNDACAGAQGHPPHTWLSKPYQFSPAFGSAIREAFYGAFFSYHPLQTYNPALWTMGIELRGSFLVFAFLALFGRLPRRAVVYGVAIPLLYRVDTFMMMFLFGVCLCDTIIGRRHAKPWPWSACAVLVLLGLMLGGLSPYWTSSYGFVWSALMPLCDVLGAVLVVAGTAAAPWQAPRVGHAVLAFLGRVSFSLYLLHIPLLLSLGCGTFLFLSASAGWPHLPSAAMATALCVAVTLTMSWLAAVTVEDASIQLGRRLSGRLRLPPDSASSRGAAIDRSTAGIPGAS